MKIQTTIDRALESRINACCTSKALDMNTFVRIALANYCTAIQLEQHLLGGSIMPTPTVQPTIPPITYIVEPKPVKPLKTLEELEADDHIPEESLETKQFKTSQAAYLTQQAENQANPLILCDIPNCENKERKLSEYNVPNIHFHRQNLSIGTGIMTLTQYNVTKRAEVTSQQRVEDNKSNAYD